jgi:hypothetical protein
MKPVYCHYIYEDGTLCRDKMTHKVDKVNACEFHYPIILGSPVVYQRCKDALWLRKRLNNPKAKQ